ncbi:sterol desaturase family protein [Pedobacter sp. BAL39]|uniref:sterol desaturase family protein n=1 Tax=Pedobacter sp. BAL39 TaxID=391596 RepID=UPI00058779C7|nr:sterol desaturase family protein [Pedobacter sp. BAL39]
MSHLFQSISVAFLITIGRYFIIAGIFFVVFYLLFPKSLLRNKIQSRLAGKADFLREIFHSSISSVMLTITAIIALSDFLRPYTFIYTDLHAYPLWWIPVSLVLTLIVHDAYFYWMHRILHHKKLFKVTHLVHHQSTNPSPWTSYSFHFLEAIAEGAVVILLVFSMPLHPLTIGLFALSSFVINVYGHLGYEIMPKGFRNTFLFEIINTSTFHNLHHQKFKGNYGLYLRVWDRLMGTEHPDYVKNYDQLQKKRFG